MNKRRKATSKRGKRKQFGKAEDFYHARIITLEEEMPPNFSWKKDVLYRAPSEYKEKWKTSYRLEIVELDSNKVYPLKTIPEKKKAEEELKILVDDLKISTKQEFENKYLSKNSH